MKKVFISHASDDEPIIKSLIDDLLVGALSVKVREIFCTTTDGMKIESGEDWRDSIKKALQEAKVTLLIITPNYKESEVCICEMGAAWVTSAKVIPFIVDPITYSSVGIIQQPKQIEELLDQKSLDRLRDVIQGRLEIDPEEIKSDRWTVKRTEFIQKVKNYISKTPFRQPLSREEFDRNLQEKNSLETTVSSLIAEKSERESFIDELKKAKDSTEIKEIEKRHKKTSSIDEFHELCEKTSGLLKKISSIIRGIAFVSFSEKEVRIRHQGWETQIEEAISKDYITERLEADWNTSKLMNSIYDSLREVSQFIENKSEDDDFLNSYDEEFEAPLSISNIDFWEEVFKVGVSIS